MEDIHMSSERAATGGSTTGPEGDVGRKMPRVKRVTRADVAQSAGTSAAVVSYVLNDGPRPVAEATRLRVLAAVESTGYRPDGIARALASGDSRTLGLVLPDLSNPFFTALGHALEVAASKVGLVFLLGDSAENPEQQSALIQRFLSHRVDGLVIVGVDEAIDLAPARSAGVPVVLLDRTLVDPEVSTVAIDNQAAARAATEHLIEHGRSRIALVSGPGELATAEARARGWEEAMRAGNLSADERWVHRTGFDRRGGYRAGLELFSDAKGLDAVFVASEQQAIGLLRAAHETGTRIPDDVAVVAFDGTEASEYCVPSLTTISQPFEELATHALELVRIPRERARNIVCDFELVRRTSCGCDAAPTGRK